MRYGKIARVENAGVEKAGVENAGVNRMEHQHEFILRKPQVTSLDLSLFF